MGLGQKVKSDTLGQQAAKAAAAGRRVFTPRLNMPGSNPGLSGDITDWSAMIEAIEAQGWQLMHWAVGNDNRGRAEAYPLFRR